MTPELVFMTMLLFLTSSHYHSASYVSRDERWDGAFYSVFNSVVVYTLLTALTSPQASSFPSGSTVYEATLLEINLYTFAPKAHVPYSCPASPWVVGCLKQILVFGFPA